jgi:hypothetical protein
MFGWLTTVFVAVTDATQPADPVAQGNALGLLLLVILPVLIP